MIPEEHRRLAERIERSARHCTDDTDWEMTIEAAMLAGTHWVNYALHATGLSGPDDDLVHVSMLMVCMRDKYRLAAPELIAALEEIEDLRPLFVRGDVDGGAGAAGRARELLSAISELALS